MAQHICSDLWGGLAQGLMSKNEISFHDLLEGV